MGELLSWANTARDPNANRVTGDGPQPQPDQSLNVLRTDGELGDGKAAGKKQVKILCVTGGVVNLRNLVTCVLTVVGFLSLLANSGCSHYVQRGVEESVSPTYVPAVAGDVVVCDLLPAREISRRYSFKSFEHLHFVGANTGYGYLRCDARFDDVKAPEFFALTIEYRCGESTYPSFDEVRNTLGVTNVESFVVNDLAGKGMRFRSSSAFEAVWQYEDGCQLRANQAVRPYSDVEKVEDPTEDLVDLVRRLARRAPQVANGPARDLTQYPPNPKDSGSSSPT